MFLKDQIKIDIVILMQTLYLQMHSAHWIKVNRTLWFFICFACIGMGPRAISSSSANSGTSTVWCRSLVGVAARGSKSASEWGAVVVRIIGRGISDHSTILEDFHRTRGKQLNAEIHWDILNKTQFFLSTDESKELRTRWEIIPTLSGENFEYWPMETLLDLCERDKIRTQHTQVSSHSVYLPHLSHKTKTLNPSLIETGRNWLKHTILH